ncbi:PREDICTED: uncharacterized protein LOC105514430 [Colobus angolensis palliatus]|uniref:uncharacterized protein LOC105514430 n=1 Tax=Colobus angolensis palliatus TaxID=336983 RepID=UPI0005F4DEA7|nr:PREDICTED: uncharacterized protein LOC105514430 [Colobus angolensis palliatus]
MKEKAAAAVIDTTLIDALTGLAGLLLVFPLLVALLGLGLVWEQTCFISTPPSASGAVASTVRGGRGAHPAQEQRSRGEETASLPTGPLCVTKFGKNMDSSQSFHVCSQLPAEKAKGSLPDATFLKFISGQKRNIDQRFYLAFAGQWRDPENKENLGPSIRNSLKGEAWPRNLLIFINLFPGWICAPGKCLIDKICIQCPENTSCTGTVKRRVEQFSSEFHQSK